MKKDIGPQSIANDFPWTSVDGVASDVLSHAWRTRANLRVGINSNLLKRSHRHHQILYHRVVGPLHGTYVQECWLAAFKYMCVVAW